MDYAYKVADRREGKENNGNPTAPKGKHFRGMKISQLSLVENFPVSLELEITSGSQVTTVYSHLTEIYMLPEIPSYDLSIIIISEHFSNKRSLSLTSIKHGSQSSKSCGRVLSLVDTIISE